MNSCVRHSRWKLLKAGSSGCLRRPTGTCRNVQLMASIKWLCRQHSRPRCRQSKPALETLAEPASGSCRPNRQLRAVSSSEDVSTLGGIKLKTRDAEILALLIPAVGSVFLDPAMQVIDTGEGSSRGLSASVCKVLQLNSVRCIQSAHRSCTTYLSLT